MNGMVEAVRGSLKEEMRMDFISNNLANATTAGFKRDKVSFQNYLLQAGGEADSTQEAGVAGEDTALIRISTDFTQGDVRSTGNELDFCISGKGFFKVMTPEGVRYTRKGSFKLDGDGYLTTQEGYQVMGKAGAVNIWGDEVQVDDKGRIRVEGAEVDQLDVVDFSNPGKLVKEGALLFKATLENDEIPFPPSSSIRQGYLEGANVNVAEEMVNMVHCMRAFESYQKAVQILDRLDTKASNEVGRLR